MTVYFGFSQGILNDIRTDSYIRPYVVKTKPSLSIHAYLLCTRPRLDFTPNWFQVYPRLRQQVWLLTRYP